MRGILYFRHGIVAFAAPWVAAADPFHAKPASLEISVAFDGLQEILRARGIKTASAARPREQVQHGGKAYLVKADEEPDHESAERIEALCANCNHSH